MMMTKKATVECNDARDDPPGMCPSTRTTRFESSILCDHHPTLHAVKNGFDSQWHLGSD